MDIDRDFIENEYIYNNTWLKYRLYSCNNYRLYLPNGVYIILNEKENYLHTNKTDYMIQIFIEQGHCIYTLKNVNVDKSRLKFIKIEDYLEKMMKKEEKNAKSLDFLEKILTGGAK